MEDDDDEVDSLVLIEEAKKCHDYGESITLSFAKDPVKCIPFLESLIQALTKREAALGRCSHETAQTYSAIGILYFQMNHPRAVVMFRASYRIEYFLYGKCTGHIDGEFKEFLVKRGLSENDVKEIRKDVLASARHEVEGDILRRFGDRRAAALEYQKAAKIEELAFGKDNPDLAFLWRKMACLVSMKKIHVHDIDFDDCDRPGNKWMRHSKENLSNSVCAMITRGDKYYQSLLYSKAIREYLKAAMSDRPKQPLKTRRKIPRPSNNSLAVEKEIRTLIANSSSTPPWQGKTQSQHTRDSTTRGEKPKDIVTKTTKKLNNETHPDGVFSDVAAASDAESLRSSANVSQVGEGLYRVHSLPTSSLSSEKKEAKADIMAEESTLMDTINKSQDMEHVVVASSVATSDDGSWYSNSQASQFLQSEPTTTRVKRKQKPFSANSLYHMVAKSSSRSLAGPQRPKSESALSRMTIKPASKLANKTMKKLRKRTKTLKSKAHLTSKAENDKSAPHNNAEPSYMLLSSPPAAEKVNETMSSSSRSEQLEKESTSGSIDNDIMSAPAVSSVPKDMPVIKGDKIPSPASPSIPTDGFTLLSMREQRRSVDHSARSSSHSFSDDIVKDQNDTLPTTFDREKVTVETPVQRYTQQQQQAVSNGVRSDESRVLPVLDNANESFIVFEDPTHSSSSPSSDGIPVLF
jgi:hypothetical protein